jgi:hypothetical protein
MVQMRLNPKGGIFYLWFPKRNLNLYLGTSKALKSSKID